MQPPGGPPGDKRHPLPPPWGHPPKTPAGPGATTLPGGHAPAPGMQPAPPPAPPPQPQPQPQPPPQPPPHLQPAPLPRPPQPPQQQPYYPPPQQQPHYPPPPAQQHYQPPAGYGGHHPPTPQPGLPLIAPPESAPLWPSATSPPAPPPGHGFGGFLKISVKRAFRVRIEPSEVLPEERAALTLVHPPIIDPTFQSFLAWRRSVLFVVACTLIPLCLFRIIELATMGEEYPGGYKALQAIPLFAEIAFAVVAWKALARWTQWERQRKPLAVGWLVFFLAPFAIYLYPMQRFFSGADELELIGVGVLISIQAMMVLAPKAISLMPGLIRASLVSKLMFPGTAAPGWLMVLATPIYALLVYVALIMPYQITGSGYFVLGMAGIIGAQFFLGRAGFKLAKPQTAPEAIETVRNARASYLLAMAFGSLFVIVAFSSLIEKMDIPVLRVVNLVLSFEASVLALTLITTDIMIDALDHHRGLSAGTDALADEAQAQIHAFVGAAGGATATPPIGPAPPGLLPPNP